MSVSVCLSVCLFFKDDNTFNNKGEGGVGAVQASLEDRKRHSVELPPPPPSFPPLIYFIPKQQT